MRKLSFLVAAIICLSAAVSCTDTRPVSERLASIPQVKKVEVLENSVFPEKYLLYFEQPVDYEDASKGTFLQRVFVGSVDPDSVNVIVTEGYGAQYAAYPRYREELSRMFNTNNIVIEHRYFLESTPFPEAKSIEEVNWSYLNARYAARDQHNIVKALKSIYKGKWIATGISKGGQTCGIFRAYYPKDVDISVPYVAPLCKAQRDGRHEPFLAEQVGTPEARQKVKDFQIEFLKRRKNIQPMFDSLCNARGYEFNLPLEEIYDYTMLEFSFAFWQWGSSPKYIPGPKATDREVFRYMMRVSDPSYFNKECPTSPFFVQAARELGYYGYDLEQFAEYKDYLRINSTEGYLQKLVLPQTTGQNFDFDPYIYDKVSQFIATNKKAKMIYIYGEDDPWSAPMVSDPHTDNIKVFVNPGGCHSTRIASFPEDTRKEITDLLTKWLYNDR